MSFISKMKYLYRDKQRGRSFLRQVVANWNELCSEQLLDAEDWNQFPLKVCNCNIYCCLDSILIVDLKLRHYTMPAASIVLKFKTDQMSVCPTAVSTIKELFYSPRVLINRTAYIDDSYLLDHCFIWLQSLFKEYNALLQPFVDAELKRCASLPVLLRQIVLRYLSASYI